MIGLFRQKQNAFGLDISDISIKVLQLEKRGAGHRILGYADHNVPKGMMVNDQFVDVEGFVSHLKQSIARLDSGKLTTKRVVASVPESKAFVRVIQLPKMDEEQAAGAIPIEAEQYIPIPLQQAYLDWEIISYSEDKMNVLVTAAPKDYIDNYLNLIKKAGLQPVSFEVESAAVARALIPPGKRENDILILDMNTYRTSLIVVAENHLSFTSSIPIAGDALTQSIARALAISSDEAEKIKREIGMPDDKDQKKVWDALAPVIDNMVAEIRNTIKFHDEHSSRKITQIILCGGTAKLSHLPSYLYEKLEDYDYMDIVLGNPWANVFDPKQKETPPLSREDSLSYTTAIGLAMRGAALK